MSAGRAEAVRGIDDAWPLDPALADRLVEPDDVVVVRPEIAHRGEAGLEHALGIGHGDDGPEAVGELQPAIAAIFGPAVEMHMHVDQPGQDRVPGKVDHLGTVGCGTGSDGGDPAFLDRDHGLREVFPGLDLQHPVGDDVARLRMGRGKRGSERGEAEQEASDHGGSPVVGC